jgi:hypothetical protein
MRLDGLALTANAMGLEERSPRIVDDLKRWLRALPGEKKLNERKVIYVDTLHVQRICFNNP